MSVSPQNRATTTTMRKPTDANSVNNAKLNPPEVASPTSCGASLPAEGAPVRACVQAEMAAPKVLVEIMVTACK